ncbi:unnamed protein product [Candida verbasci]|uniref:Prefoldin subunit 1 n=1 Tax=Candida verbasci TaxID=1227364 RepID=A0A9W4TXX9_9ASCO|nr:unnamed protein product [Candida verbasci]
MNQEALQKVLLEMDNQLNKSRAELNMVNLQIDKVNTNLKIIESTKSRLSTLCEPKERVWQGIGKAFFENDVNSYLSDLNDDEKEYKDTKKNLTIKQDYLKTTLDKTIDSMTNIVGKKN